MLAKWGIMLWLVIFMHGCSTMSRTDTLKQHDQQGTGDKRHSPELLFDKYGTGTPGWANHRADWPVADGYWNRSEVVYYSQWTVDRAAYVQGAPNHSRQTTYTSRFGRAYR
jgi:hypothetical protein